eukprot:COSAG01_NODE_60391_length_295_cov_0.678571_1_plen_21_part_10
MSSAVIFTRTPNTRGRYVEGL